MIGRSVAAVKVILNHLVKCDSKPICNISVQYIINNIISNWNFLIISFCWFAHFHPIKSQKIIFLTKYWNEHFWACPKRFVSGQVSFEIRMAKWSRRQIKSSLSKVKSERGFGTSHDLQQRFDWEDTSDLFSWHTYMLISLRRDEEHKEIDSTEEYRRGDKECTTKSSGVEPGASSTLASD